MDWSDWAHASTVLGLGSGVILGLAARRGRFCTLGAIEDALYANNWDRIRMWAVALAVAIAGTFVLASSGGIDLGQTFYARTPWNPVIGIAGGLIFGYGMAIAGNCGYGALARLGGGDLRALVIVFVTGVAAYAMLSGPIAPLRLALLDRLGSADATTAGYAHAISEIWGIQPLVPALVVAAGLGGWALADIAFRRRYRAIAWSVAVGAAVVIGWAGTSYLATHSFEIVPVRSHSFTAPLGDTIMFAMTGLGSSPGFAVGSVVGVVLGGILGSVSKGQFRWEACDDPQELRRQILGGMLMGVGGVLALGCSVGQGLSAFSTLAFSAPIVLLSVFAGAAVGLRQLIRGFEAV